MKKSSNQNKPPPGEGISEKQICCENTRWSTGWRKHATRQH